MRIDIELRCINANTKSVRNYITKILTHLPCGSSFIKTNHVMGYFIGIKVRRVIIQAVKDKINKQKKRKET